MFPRRLLPFALTAALLTPVISLASVVDTADAARACPKNRRGIARITMPAHGKVKSAKTYGVLPYSGPGTPDILHYSLGRDASTPFPDPTTGALNPGNMLVGGHSSTRLFYGKTNFEYHARFLRENPRPKSGKALTRWKKANAAWLKANKLTKAPHKKKNPAPFASIEKLKAGAIIKVRSGCWVHTYKVLGGSHETINPDQTLYALQPPQGDRAAAIMGTKANAAILKAAKVTQAAVLADANSSRLLTIYGCVKIGNDVAAKRKIVRAVHTGKTWTTKG